MKTLILLWMIAVSGIAYCQAIGTDAPPCNDPECIKKKFAYKFCNQFGDYTIKCSSDPNNEGTNPPLRPAKKATPLCFDWDFNDLEFDQIIVDPSQDTMPGENVIVFARTDMIALLNQAKYEWESMCPAYQGPNQEYQQCCLRVAFSSTETDFHKLPVGFTRGFLWDPPLEFVGKAYCRVDCSESELIMNSEREFMQPDENGVPTVFFFTRNLDALKRLRPNLEYSSALSIMLHELGHWFGFAHSSFDNDGKYCGTPASIMQEGNVGEWNQVERHTTADDKCMFMKLYCCDSTVDKLDVEETAEAIAKYTFDVVPNPAHRDLVTLKLGDGLVHDASLVKVSNAAGKTVMEYTVSMEQQELVLDVSTLTNGVYIVAVIHDRGTAGQKVVIQR